MPALLPACSCCCHAGASASLLQLLPCRHPASLLPLLPCRHPASLLPLLPCRHPASLLQLLILIAMLQENVEKIKLNNQLPYLVSNIVEVLDVDPEEDEEEDGEATAAGLLLLGF